MRSFDVGALGVFLLCFCARLPARSLTPRSARTIASTAPAAAAAALLRCPPWQWPLVARLSPDDASLSSFTGVVPGGRGGDTRVRVALEGPTGLPSDVYLPPGVARQLAGSVQHVQAVRALYVAWICYVWAGRGVVWWAGRGAAGRGGSGSRDRWLVGDACGNQRLVVVLPGEAWVVQPTSCSVDSRRAVVRDLHTPGGGGQGVCGLARVRGARRPTSPGTKLRQGAPPCPKGAHITRACTARPRPHEKPISAGMCSEAQGWVLVGASRRSVVKCGNAPVALCAEPGAVHQLAGVRRGPCECVGT
jgi:hypothetical protein